MKSGKASGKWGQILVSTYLVFSDGYAAETTEKSKDSMFPIAPVEPLDLKFEGALSPEERHQQNIKYLDPVLNQIDRFHDSDLCFNDDIAPRCTIHEKGEEGKEEKKRYQVAIGSADFISSSNLEVAKRVVKKLSRLRLCNYGAEISVEPKKF